MDEAVTLLGLSFAMLVGCYLAGVIPLTITLSEEKLKMVTVLGAGLLVGTALAVIIPEGVHAMYSNGKDHEGHSHQLKEIEHKENEVVNAVGSLAGNDDAATADLHRDHHHDMGEEHSKIGISLVTGFIFMLLVDQIGGNMHSHSVSNDAEATGTVQNRNKITATLGLVVHAAADGIALGAAITLSENHITMIVFAAIMLHKAPAAFGLVSFLLHEGLDRARIRKHLAVFSASAPLLAIITYLSLSQQNKETLSDMHTTGIAMLFSAGTFLYVATVHVLPEISTSHTQHKAPDGTVIVREQKGFKKSELAALVVGSLLPVVLAMGHKH
ncbi:zinc transporter ZIP9 [Aplysia californica]|uniref:Zinc transporter ZIP9 n=1 Tax=Aplysia californica TaxID=6500 RepID=A0ABM0JMA7_APLCA|nr:zinc transporter ZIP9 [Aplysia californica]